MLLREYASVLWLRKWLILAVMLLCVGGALVFVLQQSPVYQSSSELLVNVTSDGSPVTTPLASLMQTEARVAASAAVADLAREELDDDRSADELLNSVIVAPSPDTEILVFTGTGSTPGRARDITDEFAAAYLEFRRQQAFETVSSTTEAITEQIEELSADIEKLNGQAEETDDPAEEDTLRGQVSVLEGQMGVLRAALAEAASAGTQEPGRVIRPAEAASDPVSPQPLRTLLLALLAGLGLGIVVAFAEVRWRDRLRGRSDLEANTGVPVFAAIPKTAAHRQPSAGLVTEMQPHGAASEAYRTLRTGLLMSATRRPLTTVVITSPNDGEGKSTTTANLGVALSEAGKRVVLLSADLRRPQLHALFDAEPEPGLTDVLAGEMSAADALIGSEMTDNLRLMPSGPIPHNPTELLGSEAMLRLVRYLREAADFVLVDVPPILQSADAAVAASFADAVLLVADAERTTRGAVAAARQQLNQVGAPLIGAVLNRVDVSRTNNLYYAPLNADSRGGRAPIQIAREG